MKGTCFPCPYYWSIMGYSLPFPILVPWQWYILNVPWATSSPRLLRCLEQQPSNLFVYQMFLLFLMLKKAALANLKTYVWEHFKHNISSISYASFPFQRHDSHKSYRNPPCFPPTDSHMISSFFALPYQQCGQEEMITALDITAQMLDILLCARTRACVCVCLID